VPRGLFWYPAAMWILPSIALAACGSDLPTQLEALEGVEFVEAQAVDDLLACHTAPLTPALAARVHTLYARAYGDDPDRAAQHMYAAWEAQPLMAPGLPADHPAAARLVLLQEGLATSPAASPAPFLQVDGAASTWVRSGQPFVAQGPGRPPALVDATRPFAVPEAGRSDANRGFLVAGIASGAVAIGMYGGAWATRARYQDLVATDGPNVSRQLNHDWTNALSVGSVIGAVAGAGLLTVHVVR